MDTKIKILVAGDVQGHFSKFFQRVEKINKKTGPYEILLCVGDFFGAENDGLIAYKNGNKQIPVPTYILGPNDEGKTEYFKDIKDGEICTNLTYLGRRGLYKMECAVKIAYVSGVELSAAGEQKAEFHFNKEDIAAVRNSCLVNKSSASDYRGVDILITSQWPFGIIENNENASKLLAYLSKEIKPRYHFCGLKNKYHEPSPHRIPADEITQLSLCTRFIALAADANAAKEKNIYALSLAAVEKMRVLELIQKSTNEVPCPYVALDLSNCSMRGASGNTENTQFFFDMGGRGGGMRRHGGPGGNHQMKRPKILSIDQEKCWFCLSSPDVEKHLVISIGEHFYLALAKGPINDFHVLILSITHISNASLVEEANWQELEKFKNALRNLFKEHGQVVCFTERHYRSSHLQINALGIDKGYAWKVQHAFQDKAEEFNLQFETLPKITSPQMLPNHGPYFVAELPDNTTLITRQMKHFPLHFARDVFCSENLLNCDEKVDWKQCNLEKEIEINMVQKFRTKFSKYDFTK